EVQQGCKEYIADNQTKACKFYILQKFCPVHCNPCPEIGPCEVRDELGDREYKNDVPCHVLDGLCHIMCHVFTGLYLAGDDTKGNTDDDGEKEYDRYDTIKERRWHNSTILAPQRAVRHPAYTNDDEPVQQAGAGCSEECFFGIRQFFCTLSLDFIPFVLAEPWLNKF